MLLQSYNQLVQLDFFNQVLLQEPTPCVFYELKQQHATPMSQRIDVNQGIHSNINQSGLSQQSWYSETDGPVDPIQFSVPVEQL